MAAYEDPRELGFDTELVKTALMTREQFSSKPRKLVLGIDMGIAGIGICLMDKLNQEIVLMATHLFDCPWNPKNKTSLASARRQARSQRRNIARRAVGLLLRAHEAIAVGAGVHRVGHLTELVADCVRYAGSGEHDDQADDGDDQDVFDDRLASEAGRLRSDPPPEAKLPLHAYAAPFAQGLQIRAKGRAITRIRLGLAAAVSQNTQPILSERQTGTPSSASRSAASCYHSHSFKAFRSPANT